MNLEQYWNTKHPQGTVIYDGRAIRGCNTRIAVDVRNMVWDDDRLLNTVIKDFKGSYDSLAHQCQLYVVKNLKRVSPII